MLYTEKNNLRAEAKKSYDITCEKYALLIGICEKYLPNIYWKFPEKCPEYSTICGLNFTLYNAYLHNLIPNLFYKYESLSGNPLIPYGEDSYDQFALFDYIEFIAKNAHDIEYRKSHIPYRAHEDFKYSSTNLYVRNELINDFNEIFKITNLLYKMNDNLEIERLTDADFLISSNSKIIADIKEPGLKDYINEAIALYKDPQPNCRHLAVEKIWDAFERLKTCAIEGNLQPNKKENTNKMIKSASNNNENIENLIVSEFKELTKIGNQYKIRHSEIDKYEITDEKHYDYLFNRCFSLIILMLQYL